MSGITERMQLLNTAVQMSLLHEHEDSLGVVRSWQISCTLPALALENYGLLEIGLDSMEKRLTHISELSLSGLTTSEKSLAVDPVTGKLNLVMTVAQFVLASDLCREL